MHELATAHATLNPRASSDARVATCCSLLAACCCYCCSACSCCSCCVSLSALSLRAPLTASPSLTHTLALPPTPACPVRIDAPGLETATPLRCPSRLLHLECRSGRSPWRQRRPAFGRVPCCAQGARQEGCVGHARYSPPSKQQLSSGERRASSVSCELLPRSSGVQHPVSCVLRPSIHHRLSTRQGSTHPFLFH